MKRVRLITMLLILILACNPVLASACAFSCALHHASDTRQQVIATDIPTMDTGHCQHMHASLTSHKAASHDADNQDQSPTTQGECAMVGCHFSNAIFPLFNKQHGVFNGPDQRPLHFSVFARSAELPPPIKPPA